MGTHTSLLLAQLHLEWVADQTHPVYVRWRQPQLLLLPTETSILVEARARVGVRGLVERAGASKGPRSCGGFYSV
jgi:hypothetical protein